MCLKWPLICSVCRDVSQMITDMFRLSWCVSNDHWYFPFVVMCLKWPLICSVCRDVSQMTTDMFRLSWSKSYPLLMHDLSRGCNKSNKTNAWLVEHELLIAPSPTLPKNRTKTKYKPVNSFNLNVGLDLFLPQEALYRPLFCDLSYTMINKSFLGRI